MGASRSTTTGATHLDIDTTKKVDLAERVASGVDPDINVVKVDATFPSPKVIDGR